MNCKMSIRFSYANDNILCYLEYPVGKLKFF